MSSDPLFGLIAVMLIGAVILFLFVGSMIAARRRAPQESGLTPKYEAFCSGTINYLMGSNLSSIRLTIYESFLVVCFIKPVVIPFSELASAEVIGWWLMKQVKIETKGGDVYRLSARNPENVVRMLGHT